MSKDARYPTTLLFNNRKLWVSDAKAASEISSDCSQPIDETNVPGGKITDLTALENHIRLNYKGIHLAWKEDSVSISASSIVVPEVDPEFDEASYSKLKGLAPDDMAGVVLLAFQREVQSALDRKAAVGRVLISFKNKVDNMLRVLPQKVDTRVSTLPQDLVELSKKITVNDAITELQRKAHGVTVISTFHAPIFFSEYEGLSLYYSSSKDYVLEINGYTMTISQHGWVVSVDDGFDAELEKIKVRIFRFDEKAARAVTTLSRVLEGKLSGSYYNIWYDETNQLGQAKYPGFLDFQRRAASLFKTRLAGVVSSEGGIQVPCDKDWHHHSVPHLAFYMLYKDTLNGSTAVLNGIENFIDATCSVKADLFSTSIRELINLRKDIENSRILPFILRPQKCAAYLKSAVAIMSSFGMSCTGVRNLRVSETEVVKLVYPKFSENSARLKSGRMFRNKEPRSSLFKQYPICPGGPAVVLGEATADKAVNILATLASVAGADVLSGCSQFLYSGVTNYDRMLEIICEKWIAAHPDVDSKVALSAMTLLDKVHSSPPRWKIEYKDHKFALRTADNPSGQFVCTDLLKYLNSMDVTKGRKDFIFSDANVLGTDDDNYLTKNEFAVQTIDLGSAALDDWITGRSAKWAPSATAAAKYCLKAASKFRAGVLKLHIFDVDPVFFAELGHQMDSVFGVDSFLWKNGRGHNNEYFFYFFPKVRKTPLYLASSFYIPVLLAAVAMSEFSRHVVFYAPHRLYGMEKFGEKGYLENNPNFPILVPSFHSRSFETIKIGTKEFNGIKGLRTGLKSLVSGIKIEKPDDEEFDVRAFSSIPDADIKPVDEVDSSEIPLVLKDKGPQKVLSIKQEQAQDPLKLMSGVKTSRLALSVDELDVGPASDVDQSEDIPVIEEEEQEEAEYPYQPDKDEDSLRKQRKQVAYDDTD